jgi:hypothetical protein
MLCAVLQGLAFGMLKSTGTGVKFLRGSGFMIGRSVNSRRETRWSAPSYFHMDIRGLPPSFRGACSDSRGACSDSLSIALAADCHSGFCE